MLLIVNLASLLDKKFNHRLLVFFSLKKPSIYDRKCICRNRSIALHDAGYVCPVESIRINVVTEILIGYC